MAKRSVKVATPEEPVLEMPEMTEEELAALEEARSQERAQRLAPYRAVHEQQNEQDDLLAELLFKETLRELED